MLLETEENGTDIQVIGEEGESVISYSPALLTALTHRCVNQCGYCSFQSNDNLVVPYSTIKESKLARSRGLRSVHYIAGEKPDYYPEVRATLDLWGFSSYMEYLYNVCELGFLEGLIPTLEIGALPLSTLHKMREIVGLVRVMIDSVDSSLYKSIYPKSPGKHIESRLNMLKLTGKTQFPTITGVMVGIGESKNHRRDVLKVIAKLHATYGHIHEVVIQNFVPQKGTAFENKAPASHELMLKTVEMAFEELPSDISITVPIQLNDKMRDFIDLGIRDLGEIPRGQFSIKSSKEMDLEKLLKDLKKDGYYFQQRFPLKYSFIKEGMYSDKLGQVFDAYKHKIKKKEQEKQRDAKVGVFA